MNHQQSLIDARARLKELPQTEDVSTVLYMVENNLALTYGRRVKAFDGAFVAREVERVLGSVSEVAGEASPSPHRSEAQK